MEFRRVEYFLILAETLNFHEAADILCISPPALSRQISLLEEEVGGRLFDRTTKSVRLTSEGEAAYEKFNAVKLLWDNAITEIRSGFCINSDVIRVGFFTLLPTSSFVNPVINAFRCYNQNFDFNITSGEMSKLHSMLLNREIDLCITATNDFENWSGCKVVKYRTYPAKIMVSSKHRWSSESRVSKFDIAEDSIALLDDHKYLYPESLYRRIRTKNKLQVSDFNALIASLQMGKYFSISPEYFNGILDTKLKFIELPDSMKFDCYWACVCLKTNTALMEMLDAVKSL